MTAAVDDAGVEPWGIDKATLHEALRRHRRHATHLAWYLGLGLGGAAALFAAVAVVVERPAGSPAMSPTLLLAACTLLAA
ncbi:hypothetical protein Daura_12515 [Dactylosporangium aurantiacum]|uniref:Uncharacterized protein n=1 Tax=Dactylosporangium aurantiacum TaxID=35754 RepID=A0A9Q9MF77_9ACTN|nr:hypothetical protein [Dactylosporangium aurantiacum]MDG6104062.1 hypothetical protein [Dactylosporangium aurantiacum]UWZ56918.1 hypothetical protein Daura_12515 [Dactylosporangium aurantiacum]